MWLFEPKGLRKSDDDNEDGDVDDDDIDDDDK